MDKIINRTTLASVAFFVVAMAVVVYFSVTKQIEISNVTSDEISESKIESEAIEVPSDHHILFGDNVQNSEYLCIPLPSMAEPEDITIENHYMDKELHVIIKGVNQSFYEALALSGNRTAIEEGFYYPVEDGIRIQLNMKEIYEYKTIFENNALYISFLNPREVYEKIVVIDPGYGGNSAGDESGELNEKSISLSVAKAVKEKMEDDETKVYFTRMDDVNPSDTDRIKLANSTKADMYIRIETDLQEDESVYGVTAVYNDEYFIPGFGNVKLSDIMETAVVTAVKGKALGLKAFEENDTTLRYATVPATTIRVGCLSNKQEAILLGREDYMEKLAQGICDGIKTAYEQMGK